jgi:hypothetical protein
VQVFAEVAIIILDEFTPAQRSWFAWRDIMHLVDMVCCFAIVFPIVWRIKHLREAAETDGKAERCVLPPVSPCRRNVCGTIAFVELDSMSVEKQVFTAASESRAVNGLHVCAVCPFNFQLVLHVHAGNCRQLTTTKPRRLICDVPRAGA